MLAMLRDLVAHKWHANAALLSAIRQNQTAASDPQILQLLHHILLANRFWLLTVLNIPFALDEESRPAESFAALVQRYAVTQSEESGWLRTATEADLDRILHGALIPHGECSTWQAFMQVCLHSHGHRVECAKRLRHLGGAPPQSDFIIWLRHRPEADWASVAGHSDSV